MGKCYISNVTVIPLGDIKKFTVTVIFQFVCSYLFSNNYSSSCKAWVFWYITRSIFPELFKTVTVQCNQLGLTDKDPSEYRMFETNTMVNDNYKHSKVMLCSFHTIWKPFKENIRPRLPKDSGGLLLSTIGRKYGKSQWFTWKILHHCVCQMGFCMSKGYCFVCHNHSTMCYNTIFLLTFCMSK